MKIIDSVEIFLSLSAYTASMIPHFHFSFEPSRRRKKEERLDERMILLDGRTKKIGLALAKILPPFYFTIMMPSRAEILEILFNLFDTHTTPVFVVCSFRFFLGHLPCFFPFHLLILGSGWLGRNGGRNAF